MTDIRAALEALMARWDAEVRAMPDSRVRTVLQSCATEVRAILLDPVIARAALAAASPEPERCECGCHDGGWTPGCGPDGEPHPSHVCDCSTQPAPAAPSVEALRDAVALLIHDLTDPGDYPDPDCRCDESVDAVLRRHPWLDAAARADERTRLSGITHHEGEPTDVGPDTYRGFGGRTLLDAGEA